MNASDEPYRSLFARCCATLVLAAVASPAAAQGAPLRNESLLARGFALPALGAGTLAPGEHALQLRYDLSNEFYTASENGEVLLIDGETNTFTLAYRAAVFGRFEWSLELPLVRRDGGWLDSTIESWHDFWGLPDGNRSPAPQDRLRYYYARDGQTLFDLQASDSDFGDLSLGAGWRATEGLTLRALLELPTGDEETFTGGTSGGALWAEWTRAARAELPIFVYLSGGLSINETAGPLAEMMRQEVFFAGAGLGWQFLPRVAAGLQVYAHTPLYEDSDLRPLEEPGTQLALFLQTHLTPRLDASFALQEDLVTDSSPDLALHASLQWRFRTL